MSPLQFPLLPPTAPLPDWLNVPTGPEVKVVTALVDPSLSLKLPEVIALPFIVADPAVPAVLFLKGPCTPPPVPLAPPPAAKVNKDPVEDPERVVFVPADAVFGCPKLGV